MITPPFTHSTVEAAFSAYPEPFQQKLLELRALVFEAAEELGIEEDLHETLKWSEPAYLAPKGSTVRMDWKAKQPEQCALYFHCQSRLVETFRELYPDEFSFDGNRAIVFSEAAKVNKTALKHCLRLTLNYHQVKHLPLLGA